MQRLKKCLSHYCNKSKQILNACKNPRESFRIWIKQSRQQNQKITKCLEQSKCAKWHLIITIKWVKTLFLLEECKFSNKLWDNMIIVGKKDSESKSNQAKSDFYKKLIK